MSGGRAPRLAAVLITLAAAALAGAHPTLTVRGEVGLDSGVHATSTAEATRTSVPVSIRARLEVEAALGGTTLRLLTSPALAAGAGLGEAPHDVRAQPGLQEALLRHRTPRLDLSAGLERWSMGEMRLREVLRLDGRLATGEPRGLLGARAAYYPTPWRLRAGLLVPVDAEARLGSLGGALALRRESGPLTLEAHAAWTERPVLGVTASGTVGELVAYGETWLLGDPVRARGGLGLTGFAGDVLWTLEGVWAPEDAALSATASRPAVHGSARLSPLRDLSVEASAGVAWPRARGDPARRTPVLDLGVQVNIERPDLTWSVRPALHAGDGITTVGVGTSVRAFF
ncbi:MAG: hypothetical protein U5K81_04695 [Trueperaceae bacterium]|nr:hypothetical protein [Trueperaceae bacterium]